MVGIITVVDLLYVINLYTEYKILIYVFGLLLFLEIVSTNWFFILLSRYKNSVGQMIKNSMIVGMGNIGKSIIIIFLFLLPYVPLILCPKVIPIVILLGFSVTGLFQAKIYSRVFDRLERTDEK